MSIVNKYWYIMIERKLRRLIIRTPKDKANFVYYLLESHEGLIFHTTLDIDKHLGYRDIMMTGDLTLADEITHLLSEMKQTSNIEILEDRIISDRSAMNW